MSKVFEEESAKRDGHKIAIQCLLLHIGITRFSDMLHYHDYIEVIYMLAGNARIYEGIQAINICAGDLAVINSKEPHSVQGMSENCEYIVVKFKPQLLYTADFSVVEMKYLAPFVLSGDPQKRIFRNRDFADFDVGGLLKGVLREWDDKQIGYEMIMRADILRLFTWIIRYWNRRRLYDVSRIENNDPAIKPIRSVIEMTAQNGWEISCEEAAKFCGMSYSYFSRSFKRIMGLSFTEYLMHLRINEADRLLATTDKTVTDIAQSTGFSSDAYLISCFKKAKGMTPGNYRAMLRKNRI